jgi:hypothetical protein
MDGGGGGTEEKRQLGKVMNLRLEFTRETHSFTTRQPNSIFSNHNHNINSTPEISKQDS